MKAILLAGGFGTRLAKISGDRPKVLMEVAGKTLLERQVDFLAKYGIRDIRLSLHHRADQIVAFCKERWPGKFEFLVEPIPLGTGGGIRFASRDLKDPFLVVNGDILTDMDVGSFTSQKANSIACAYLEDARDFGLVQVRDGKAHGFVEKPKEGGAGYINAGYYLLKPDAFSHVAKEVFMIERDVFPYLAEKGELGAFIHKGYWTDVGTEERLARAHDYHS